MEFLARTAQRRSLSGAMRVREIELDSGARDRLGQELPGNGATAPVEPPIPRALAARRHSEDVPLYGERHLVRPMGQKAR